MGVQPCTIGLDRHWRSLRFVGVGKGRCDATAQFAARSSKTSTAGAVWEEMEIWVRSSGSIASRMGVEGVDVIP
jgi:hypothetical protein